MPLDEGQAAEKNVQLEKTQSQIYSEVFGRDFKGEIKEPTPEETVKDQDGESDIGEAEDQTDKPIEEEATGPEDEKAEAEDHTDKVDASSEEEEGEDVQSFQELIETNGWDQDWAQSLKVPIIVNGASSETSIADLVEHFQKGEMADVYLSEAKTKAKEANDHISSLTANAQKQLSVANSFLESAEKVLDIEVSETNWSDLRESDPAEYAARKNDLTDRRNAIKSIKEKAEAAWDGAIKESIEQSTIQGSNRLAEEQKKLLKHLPEWGDKKVLEEVGPKFTAYLSEHGVTEEELRTASDHRLFLFAEKARRYDEIISRTKSVKKKLKKIPKSLKPGSPKSHQQVNTARVAKQAALLKKSGRMEDYLALRKQQRGG